MATAVSEVTEVKTEVVEETIVVEKELITVHRERLENIDVVRTQLKELLGDISAHNDQLHDGFKELYSMVADSQSKFTELTSTLAEMQTKFESQKKSGDEAKEEVELVLPEELPEIEFPEMPDEVGPVELPVFERKNLPPIAGTATLNQIFGGPSDDLMSIPVPEEDEKGLEEEFEDEFEEEEEEEEENDEVVSEDEEDLKEDEELMEMIEQEAPDKLLKMKLPASAKKLLGDPKKYKLPKKKGTLNREMRKLASVLRDVDEKERQYTKLSFLKHYDILFETYKKYCKIGGDSDWLSERGWKQMINDAWVPPKKNKSPLPDAYENVFNEVYNAHHKPRDPKAKLQHSRLQTLSLANLLGPDAKPGAQTDSDPWTGRWKQNTSDGTAAEVYRLKQLGDAKITGCIKTADFCEVSGSLGAIDHSKAKLIVKWKEGARAGQVRIYQCKLKMPSDKLGGDPTCTVSWTEKAGSQATTQTGEFKMTKQGALDNDDGLKLSIGLARHEFFEAALQIATMKFPDLSKFEALDKLVMDHIIQYIWGSVDAAKKEVIKRMFKQHTTELHKLFFKYAAGDADGDDTGMGLDEWLAFSRDVLDAAVSGTKFNKGGKPNPEQQENCFNLALPALEEEMAYPAFEKAVQNLADACFKRKPKAKYTILKQEDKLKMILGFSKKLHKKGGKVDLSRQKTMK